MKKKTVFPSPNGNFYPEIVLDRSLKKTNIFCINENYSTKIKSYRILFQEKNDPCSVVTNNHTSTTRIK